MTEPAEQKKGGGRPSRAEGPRFPRAQLDQLLVHGETIPLSDGTFAVEFPTYRQLADRFGITASVVSEYARRHNVKHRRQAAQDRVQSRVEEKIVEFRAQAIAMTRDDEIRLVDKYLLDFGKALEAGKVRCDTIADLNTALRLKAFLQGEADSRSEVQTVIKLEELQERHRLSIRRVEVLTVEERGEIVRSQLPEGTSEPLRFEDSLEPDRIPAGMHSGDEVVEAELE